MFPDGIADVVVAIFERPRAEELRQETESVRKAGHYSYKNEGKSEDQVKKLPELQKAIEAKKSEWKKGLVWPTSKDREGESYREALRSNLVDKSGEHRIGGSPKEQEDFFDRVIAANPHCFWLEGCAAPTIRDHVVEFKMKIGAKPVARQPIPLSPYDDMRVEYHIAENVEQGKLRKIDTLKEGLPDWSTPVFVVDQDAKGLLGRMVCAYGPVNKELEVATFPSADPKVAFEIAAGKDHHTLVDAIWGYTQFLLGPKTRRMLIVCTRSGLYEWLRMPFGPAPAPAHMQSYVQQTFGVLRDKEQGTPYCTPLMDDICVSSATFEKHVEHLNELCAKARQRGFEFKFLKGQFNKAELELGGCVCGKHGRRAMPKKIDQLENWPEPTNCQQLNSFLCFVNYLAEYMDPDWVKHQAVLSPLRKKDADFTVWGKDPKYRNAFLEVRKGLSRSAILVHPDFEAAARPDLTGRPFENFIDASDFGWAAVLTQRPAPHAVPKIIAMIAKAFSDTQLRWSAMEREFFALWQGVTGHERLIKGFKCYCYIDHRNNLFNEALLENRRIAKKMSNWALELQAFNIVRIWIRGEANILADAPSRAPWENVLAEHLPIPQGPLREVIRTMYRRPDAFEAEVQDMVVKRKLDVGVWKGLTQACEDGDTDTVLSDYSYASSGKRRGSAQTEISGATPKFGANESVKRGSERVERWREEFGPGGVIEEAGPVYPCLPIYCLTEGSLEEALPVGEYVDLPVPVDPRDVPHSLQRITDTMGDNYVVRWPRKAAIGKACSHEPLLCLRSYLLSSMHGNNNNIHN